MLKIIVVHNFVDHKFVYYILFSYICLQNQTIMNKAFVYGMSVEGENFTDRVKETRRLKLDFENGINVILISPRRMGKSSIVRKVKSEITDPTIKVVFMDIYDCRSEYDFYNRFASVLLKETATKTEQVIENIKNGLIKVIEKQFVQHIYFDERIFNFSLFKIFWSIVLIVPIQIII